MTGPSSWTRAMVVHPAGCARSSSLTSRALLPSRRMSPWAPVCLGFRGCFPMGHILVCLRIAVVVTHAVARLATDLRDCALVGRDSHPLDGNFRISRASEFSFLSDQPFLVATTLPSPEGRGWSTQGIDLSRLFVGIHQSSGPPPTARTPAPA